MFHNLSLNAKAIFKGLRSNTSQRHRSLRQAPAFERLETRFLPAFMANPSLTLYTQAGYSYPFQSEHDSTTFPADETSSWSISDETATARAIASDSITPTSLTFDVDLESDATSGTFPMSFLTAGAIIEPIQGTFTLTTASTVTVNSSATASDEDGNGHVDGILAYNGPNSPFYFLQTNKGNITDQYTLNAGTYYFYFNCYTVSRILPFYETGNSVGANSAKFHFEMDVTPVKAETTTKLAPTPNPSTYGQSVTFASTVLPTMPNQFIPTGSVLFMDGSTILNPGGTLLDSLGTATFVTTPSQLIAGAHSVTAIYSGDGNFSGSTSPAVPQVVNQAVPKVSVNDPGGVANGQSFPATATVAGVIAGVDDTPANSLEGVGLNLTYYSGGTPLPGAPSVAGQYTVMATFPGSKDYESSSAMTSFIVVDRDPNSTVDTQFLNTQFMHKLLYAYQNLTVNLSVSNKATKAVKGLETFYLSTNQTPSIQVGDTTLLAIGNVYIELEPGQTTNLPQNSEGLTVTIPGNIQPGTYYLKATFTAIDNETNDTIAVSPVLTTSVNDSGHVSDFSSFPQNATIFDNAVTVVKRGDVLPIPTINNVVDIESFIESNEGTGPTKGGKYFTYLDKGVPAIGFGSDLEDKNGNVNTSFRGLIQSFIDKNPTFNNSKGFRLTFQDFLNRDPNAFVDKSTVTALFNTGFQTAYTYVTETYTSITFAQQAAQIAALTDIAYNVGVAGLMNFVSMNVDIAKGTPIGYASAGLELINSQRTTQIPPKRTYADFYLLTSSSGVEDQL